MFPLAHKTLSMLNTSCWALCQTFSGQVLLSSSFFFFFVLRRFQSKSSYLSQNKTQEKCNVFLILKKPEPFLWRVQVLHLILAQELNWKHKRKISFMEVSPAKKSSCPSCIPSALRNCICPFSRANMGSSCYVLGDSHFVSIWGWITCLSSYREGI